MEYPQSNLAMEKILVDGSLLNPEKCNACWWLSPIPLKNMEISWDYEIPNWMDKKHVPNHQTECVFTGYSMFCSKPCFVGLQGSMTWHTPFVSWTWNNLVLTTKTHVQTFQVSWWPSALKCPKAPNKRCLLTACPRNMRFGGWIGWIHGVGTGGISAAPLDRFCDPSAPASQEGSGRHGRTLVMLGTRQVLQILLPYPKNCRRHIVTLGVDVGGSSFISDVLAIVYESTCCFIWKRQHLKTFESPSVRWPDILPETHTFTSKK